MGDLVWLLVGVLVGLLVGDLVGLFVGDLVGLFVGDLVGLFVGDLVGLFVGDLVGLFVCDLVGLFVGDLVELFVGGLVGLFVGDLVLLRFFFVFVLFLPNSTSSAFVSPGGGSPPARVIDSLVTKPLVGGTLLPLVRDLVGLFVGDLVELFVVWFSVLGFPDLALCFSIQLATCLYSSPR